MALLLNPKHLDNQVYLAPIMTRTGTSRTGKLMRVELMVWTHYKNRKFTSMFIVKVNHRTVFQTSLNDCAVAAFSKRCERYLKPVETSA